MTTSSIPPAPPPSADPPYGTPPPGPALRPRLQRSRSDKVLGGVAGGLAEYTGIDVLLWRVGVIALTLAGGTGVLVYALLWLLTPAAPVDPNAPVSAKRMRQHSGPRSPVPTATIATTLITLGVLALVSQVTGWDPAPTTFLASALLVVGAGLVVGALTRARNGRNGLIVLGAVLTAAVAASTTDGGDWERGVGDREWRPMSAAEVQSRYDSGVGDATLDLTRLAPGDPGLPVRVQLDSGVGDVDVFVPDWVDVRVQVENGIGDVEVFGEDVDWDDQRSSFHPGDGTPSDRSDRLPEITLVINSGIGDVEVSRA